MLKADPSAFLEACYCEAHVFVSSVPAGLSAVWVRCVESGRVSPRSLSAAFWLCTGPHCHVERKPVFTCHFCWCPCVSWGPHLWYQCPSAVWRASYVFTSALPYSRALVLCGTCPTTARCVVVILWSSGPSSMSRPFRVPCILAPAPMCMLPGLCVCYLVWCTPRGTPRWYWLRRGISPWSCIWRRSAPGWCYPRPFGANGYWTCSPLD